MIPARAGTKILASLAILFLLGFGFVVYAVPGAVSPPRPLASASSPAGGASTLGDKVSFQLVQVAAVANASPNANASGYAGISITGQSLSVEWSITGAVSGALLELDMQAVATSSTGTSKSFAIATAQVNADGEVGSTGSATLDPGNYSIGLTVVDSSTDAHSAVFTSDPATAQVTIPSSQDGQTQPNRAIGNTMSYSLVPLGFLGDQAASNFSFREGGALIVISGDQLQVTTSFLGSPNTEFVNVIQTAHQNITAGTVTTTSTGGGVFKGSVTLEPGTYDVGILVYVSGNTASPVAVSDPRAIEVTLPIGTQTSTTSASSENSSSASSSTTTVSTSETKTTGVPPPETVNGLTLAPVTTTSAPQGYLYGKGTGGFAVAGGSIYFSLLFVGQNPDTRYSLILSVNGTSRTIGNYTTNNEGSAATHTSAPLGTGEFALTLSVVDSVNFNSPTVVLTTVPASFTVAVHATSTTSSTTESSSTETETQRGGSWTFKLIPATVTSVPPGYHFATSGTAIVLLDARHSLLSVVLGFQNGNPSTTYSAALVINGTSVNLGSLTTNREGGAELHSSIQINPGTYLIGVEVYDVSDASEFNASGPVLVLTSDPNAQVAVIVPKTAESSSSTSVENSSGSHGSTTAQSAGTGAVASTVTTIDAGSEVEAQIHDAVANLTIPATVQITPLASSTTVLDSRFSLSVGQQVGNGLVIAISGENVTGPRVLLINISRTAPLALYPALNITLDGVPVVQATSTLQVLNPTPSDPARYVLVATANSFQLLVSIPHFSLHLIQIAGQVVQNVESSLALDAPLLVGSIVVLTLVFAGAYAARKRYFSILP